MTTESSAALGAAAALRNYTGDFDTANTAASIDRLRLYDNPGAEIDAAVEQVVKASSDPDALTDAVRVLAGLRARG